jgi:hypothetical protein
MTSHTNQVISVVIRGDTDIDLTAMEKSIESISKDLSDEPNEAVIEIYNLNSDTRTAVKAAADQYAPIEIGVSPLHSADPVTAFVGEIETVVNRATRPGFATRVRALAQKRAHRAAYVSQKTYAAGTPKADIVNDLVTAIGLPSEIDTIPTTGILLGQSFSGAAFPILQRFVFDFGMFCYIDNGVLHITNVYDPPNPTVVEITENMLITEPQETTRRDARDTALFTVANMTNIEPGRKKKRRKKQKTLRKELISDLLARNVENVLDGSDYVEIEAVDITVPGIELECFAIPNLAPDHLITLDGGETHYRVFETEMYGDDMRDGERPTTRIRADRFEGGVSDTGATT